MRGDAELELRRPGLRQDGAMMAFRRVAPLVVCAALPAAAVVGMFVTALVHGPFAHDFRNELHPDSRALVGGDNPYPETIWPPLALVVATPFSVLPSLAAGLAVTIAGLVCMALALWVVGVRDWRIYGIVALWPSVLADIRIAHLTPFLCLLVALTWRARDRPAAAAAALGAAGGVKLFLWPLGVWLVATGRSRAAALSATLAVGSLVVIAPFAPLGEYADTLREVAARYDQDAYSWFGLLTRLGTGDLVARVVTYLAGALLLVLVWRRQSPTLAVAAALVLSPIVWLDFFALAAVPLAVARPTLSATWFVPLLTWGLPSSAIATDVWGVGRGLAVFAFVFAVAELGGSTTLASRRLGPS